MDCKLKNRGHVTFHPVIFQLNFKRFSKIAPKLGNLLGFARIYMGIRSSNGALESSLRAVMLCKLDEQNQAQNV